MVDVELTKAKLRKKDCLSFAMKGVANTRFQKKEQRKTTYSVGRNDTETDFVLVGKNKTEQYIEDVKAIPSGNATSAGSNRPRQKKVEKSGKEQGNCLKKGFEVEGKNMKAKF